MKQLDQLNKYRNKQSRVTDSNCCLFEKQSSQLDLTNYFLREFFLLLDFILFYISFTKISWAVPSTMQPKKLDDTNGNNSDILSSEDGPQSRIEDEEEEEESEDRSWRR